VHSEWDKPVDPPLVFAACCETFGHCVPDSILSTDQKASLSKDTCTGKSDLCAPDVFAVPGQTASACRALGFRRFGGQMLAAVSPVCGVSERQADVGSCNQGSVVRPLLRPAQRGEHERLHTKRGQAEGGQEGLSELLRRRGDVRSDVARARFGAEPARQGQLHGHGALCAPTAFIDPKTLPKSCTAPGNLEARCLPSCLPPCKLRR